MDRLDKLRRRLRQRVTPPRRDGFLPPTADEPPVAEPSIFEPPRPAPPPATGPLSGTPPARSTPRGESFLTAGPVADDGFLPPPSGQSAPTAPRDAATSFPPDTSKGVEVATGWGPCWRLTWPADELGYDSHELAARFTGALSAGTAALLAGAAPERLLFLDLETTGLRGVPLFLCGLARLEGEAVTTELWLARTLAEEPAVITQAAGALAAAELLVTYNGTRFDRPFLSARARYFDLKLPRCRHLDLLPPCRERYRRSFGNCRLRTLEERVCGHARSDDDPPGSAIPGLYADYCRTGDLAPLWPVLRHNACDLLAMVDLLGRW